MNLHETDLARREALEALRLFLGECSLDRPRGELPLRDLVDTDEVEDFHGGVEDLLRGLLVEYSLEQRAQVLKEGLRRQVRRQLFH